MITLSKSLLVSAFIGLAGACAMADPIKNETPIEFEASGGKSAEAQSGYLMVPENRANPESRQIRLEYVRFPSTSENPGTPIIYLAGGPGGSGIGTAKGRRFPLFMAMREFGDVIAFDQRGTGASNDMPSCESSQYDPDTEAISDEELVRRYKAAADECLDFWKSEGIDIYGYRTTESAKDLDDLRKHLGAEKVSLWGISYGSHLALAASKEMGDRIDRMVLASVEGLDQTVKSPARTDAYFDRLQAAINQTPELSEQLPDIKSTMRSVFAKLDAEPIMLAVPQRSGGTMPFLLQRRDLQQVTSGMISDPQFAIMAMQLYAELDAGGTEGISQMAARFVSPNEPISLFPMNFAMDLASGTGEARKQAIAKEAETSLLKDYLNFPMPHLDSHVSGLDLGDGFRTAPVSNIPLLVLSGTLDGRTYPESQKEAVAGFGNATIVTVENAGHNLFMVSPEVTTTIQSFMRGETIETDTITASIPTGG